ncbi:MAG: hypothetical protein H6744_07540 [Deltaproteobacteria bacterium]|nr:hypothetical protein [Deltaproteobacteria bacterium]
MTVPSSIVAPARRLTPCVVALAALLAACAGGESPVADVDAGLPDVVVADDGGFPLQDPGPDQDAPVPFETLTPPDAGPGPGECTGALKGIQCGCNYNGDCFSGWCIPVDQGPFSSVCTEPCGGAVTCADDWSCKPVSGSGDQISICVPPVVVLCRECSQNSDCGGTNDLCLDLSDGRQCGIDCGPGTEPCPPAYECAEVTGPGGTPAQQCVPKTGACTCGEDVDFQTDPINCGKCKRGCEFPHAVPGCVDGGCVIAGCEDGWVELNETLDDGCEYECTKTSDIDLPDAAGIDSNCDGVDGEAARGIFVALYGKASGAGTRNSPVATISQGLAKAVAAGNKDMLFVAGGEYREQVVAVDGVSIYGGYSPDGLWERDPASYETIIIAEAPDETGQVRTVVMEGLTKTTVLGGLTINAGSNTLESGSSYGVWMRDCGDAVRIIASRVIGGNGGPGKPGGNGTKGSPGAQGQPGTQGLDDCSCNEPDSYQGKGGAPGPPTCPGDKGGGGKGASSKCKTDTPPSGSPSPGGAAGGGPSSKGDDGDDGDDGTHGKAGDGLGEVGADGLWRGSKGADGGAGGHGIGGGGGGAGQGIAGCTIIIIPAGGVWGGGGGGGGSAGCGGQPGKGGTPGGGSFGIFAIDSDPLIQNTVVGHRSGGNGGNGGLRGKGGAGQVGGTGGLGGNNFKAGDGGHGGHGGDGGNGGGGGGGVAFGIYAAGSSAPSCQSVTYEPLGTGGLGGIGGDSLGNQGQAGKWAGSSAGFQGCP